MNALLFEYFRMGKPAAKAIVIAICVYTCTILNLAEYGVESTKSMVAKLTEE